MSDIQGLEDMINKLKRYSATIETDIKGTIGYYLSEIEKEAIRNAPGPGSMISTSHGPERESRVRGHRGSTPINQGIGVQIAPNGLDGTVYIDSSVGPIAAWVEFGTGQSARRYLMTVPPEWREFARRYYINGRGTILAQPFLYPAFIRNEPLAIQDIKEILEKITR
jgi:hypothetical protein